MSATSHVLISSAGRRGELVQIFRRSLPPGSMVHTADMSSLSAAGQLADQHHLVPPVTSPDLLPAIESLCQTHGISHVVPTIDPELPVYAAARDRLRDRGITVWVSGVETVGLGQDKRATQAFLREHGLPTVAQWTRDEAVATADLPFPVIAKPAGGSASKGLQVLTSAAQVEALPTDGDYVVEETAPGIEHTIDVLVDRDGVCRATVPRRRLEVRAGEVSKGVTVASAPLEKLARRVAEQLPDAFGVLNMQIFHDEATGRMSVIELNARFGGGFPLAYHAGCRAPAWLLDHLAGTRELEADALSWRSGVLMLRYDQGVYAEASEVGLAL